VTTLIALSLHNGLLTGTCTYLPQVWETCETGIFCDGELSCFHEQPHTEVLFITKLCKQISLQHYVKFLKPEIIALQLRKTKIVRDDWLKFCTVYVNSLAPAKTIINI
jgi:hypothetical protein